MVTMRLELPRCWTRSCASCTRPAIGPWWWAARCGMRYWAANPRISTSRSTASPTTSWPESSPGTAASTWWARASAWSSWSLGKTRAATTTTSASPAATANSASGIAIFRPRSTRRSRRAKPPAAATSPSTRWPTIRWPDELLDFFGGAEDLKNRVLRATSDAFAEDPLRVLRGMQFACRFDLTLDPGTAAMCQTIVGSLRHDRPRTRGGRIHEVGREKLAPGPDRGVSEGLGLGRSFSRDRTPCRCSARSRLAPRGRRRHAHDVRCRCRRADCRARER